MSEGYAITNALTGLAATAFTWSSTFTANRSRLNDGRMDAPAAGAGSAQASGQTLRFDLGAATALVGIALLNHNLATGSCTVSVEAATQSDYSDVAAVKAASTITTAAPNQKDTVLQFPSTNKRYWQITFTHSGSKIVTVSEVMALTSIVTLSRSSIYGGVGESERYVQNRNESRTGYVHATFLAGPIRTKRLPFKDLSTSERNELMTMWRATLGGALNLLWLDSIESTSTAATAAGQACLWGKLRETFGWTEDDFRLFGVDALELTGLGREVGS